MARRSMYEVAVTFQVFAGTMSEAASLVEAVLPAVRPRTRESCIASCSVRDCQKTISLETDREPMRATGPW